MAGGQHEAIAIGPVRRCGIEAKRVPEQGRGHIGHTHGHAWMARVGRLHGVHGERSDGICQLPLARLVDVIGGHGGGLGHGG